MALYVFMTEGYTDCALLEAILESCMEFQRYTNVHDMPELFQKLVGSYPSGEGEMHRKDMPHFYYKGDKKVAVKVAGGASKITKQVEGVLQAISLCNEGEKFSGFLVFTDADERTKKGIMNEFESGYRELDIEYKIGDEALIFEEESYPHAVYVYPQNGIGAVEKILLEIAQAIYPELSDRALSFRGELMKEEFLDFRRKNWASSEVKQELYADKIQFGAIASGLKPDRPVGFVIKDKLVCRDKLERLNQLEEFQKLYNYLAEKLS